MRNEQQAYIKTHNVHFFIGFETLHDETASMQLKQSRTEVAILAMSGLVIVSVYLQKKKKRASSSYDFEAKQLTLCSGRSGSALHWAFQ